MHRPMSRPNRAEKYGIVQIPNDISVRSKLASGSRASSSANSIYSASTASSSQNKKSCRKEKNRPPSPRPDEMPYIQYDNVFDDCTAEYSKESLSVSTSDSKQFVRRHAGAANYGPTISERAGINTTSSSRNKNSSFVAKQTFSANRMSDSTEKSARSRLASGSRASSSANSVYSASTDSGNHNKKTSGRERNPPQSQRRTGLSSGASSSIASTSTGSNSLEKNATVSKSNRPPSPRPDEMPYVHYDNVFDDCTAGDYSKESLSYAGLSDPKQFIRQHVGAASYGPTARQGTDKNRSFSREHGQSFVSNQTFSVDGMSENSSTMQCLRETLRHAAISSDQSAGSSSDQRTVSEDSSTYRSVSALSSHDSFAIPRNMMGYPVLDKTPLEDVPEEQASVVSSRAESSAIPEEILSEILDKLPNEAKYDYYQAKLFSSSLGTMFYRPNQLKTSLYLHADPHLIAKLCDLPVVGYLAASSSLAKTGVQVGHILLAVNGKPVYNPEMASYEIKIASRPITLLFSIPEFEINSTEGFCMAKYDSRSFDPPKTPKDWKPKYAVVGGMIAPPHVLSLFRSKEEYDRAVMETKSKKHISVKIKQFSLKKTVLDVTGGIKSIRYEGKMHPWNYITLLPSPKNSTLDEPKFPIKLASTSIEQMELLYEAIRRFMVTMAKNKLCESLSASEASLSKSMMMSTSSNISRGSSSGYNRFSAYS